MGGGRRRCRNIRWWGLSHLQPQGKKKRRNTPPAANIYTRFAFDARSPQLKPGGLSTHLLRILSRHECVIELLATVYASRLPEPRLSAVRSCSPAHNTVYDVPVVCMCPLQDISTGVVADGGGAECGEQWRWKSRTKGEHLPAAPGDSCFGTAFQKEEKRNQLGGGRGVPPRRQGRS